MHREKHCSSAAAQSEKEFKYNNLKMITEVPIHNNTLITPVNIVNT